MSDAERIPPIENHSVTPLNCTSAEIRKNAISYVNKLSVCNTCILINNISIILIRTVIGALKLLNPATAIKLEISITIVIYLFLICLLIVKFCLTHKLLAISKRFNIHINKIYAVFIILIIIDLSLYISYILLSSDNSITILLLVFSGIVMVFASMIIGAESIYINFKIIYIRF